MDSNLYRCWHSIYCQKCRVATPEVFKHGQLCANCEIERLSQENAKLRRELEQANAEIGDLEDCRESLRRLGEYCGCDHVEDPDERSMQVRHIHEAFCTLQQQLATARDENEQNLERINRWRDAYINLRDKTREQQGPINDGTEAVPKDAALRDRTNDEADFERTEDRRDDHDQGPEVAQT